ERLADARYRTTRGRVAGQHELDTVVAEWTATRGKFDVAAALQQAGVPAAAVQAPAERIDHDPATAAWGLWPEVEHPVMGRVRVDGLPVHLSETDWCIERPSPLLGGDNEYVYCELLGLTEGELESLRDEGVV